MLELGSKERWRIYLGQRKVNWDGRNWTCQGPGAGGRTAHLHLKQTGAQGVPLSGGRDGGGEGGSGKSWAGQYESHCTRLWVWFWLYMGWVVKGFRQLYNTRSWRRGWLPILVFLSGKSHGQTSLAGHSPWGLTESDRTEQLTHTKHKIRSRFWKKKITWAAQRRGFGELTGIIELERTSQTGFLNLGTIDILG